MQNELLNEAIDKVGEFDPAMCQTLKSLRQYG